MSVLINKDTNVICRGFTGSRDFSTRTGDCLRHGLPRRNAGRWRHHAHLRARRCSTPCVKP